jgi:hypothetical protein
MAQFGKGQVRPVLSACRINSIAEGGRQPTTVAQCPGFLYPEAGPGLDSDTSAAGKCLQIVGFPLIAEEALCS